MRRVIHSFVQSEFNVKEKSEKNWLCLQISFLQNLFKSFSKTTLIDRIGLYTWMDHMPYIVLLSYKYLMSKSSMIFTPRVFTSRYYGICPALTKTKYLRFCSHLLRLHFALHHRYSCSYSLPTAFDFALDTWADLSEYSPGTSSN